MAVSNTSSETGALILIVEDNEKNMKLARDVLQYHGFRTLEATTAPRGLDLAAEHHPDLILMDIQLPGMDGLTALRALRADPALAETKILALTAFAMKDDRERFVSAGFDGYLSKPISIRELPVVVRRHLGQG
jgi:two-component system cell cycle response regulator DivK